MEERKKKVGIADKKVPKKTGFVEKGEEKAVRKPANKTGAKPAAKLTSKPVNKANKPAAVKDVDGKGNAISKKPASKGKYGKAKPQSKPWEKMNQKAGEAAKETKKPVKEMRDFLYLLPKKASAKSLASTLNFMDQKDVEVWEDECVIEITAGEGIITFEDIRESLEKEDKEILNGLRMKQVLSCDYESTDAELVKKIMETFLKNFGGKIGSDTEDFEPFLELENI